VMQACTPVRVSLLRLRRCWMLAIDVYVHIVERCM
jgi:hypothetical protein